MLRRPAETGAVAAAIAYLIGDAVAIDDPTWLAACAIAIGFVPAAITWAVSTFRGSSSS